MKTLTAIQQQRRERILASTREQLSQLGYEGLNMRDLAVVADVSTSTLYNLYQSKDALILAALEDLLSEINERVEATGATGLARCMARFEEVAEQIVSTPRYAEAMGRMLFNADASDPIVRALMSAAFRQHCDELVEMQTEGILRETVDIEFTARSLTACGWAAVLMWMKGFVALHDFKREYLRQAVVTITACLTSDAAEKLRKRYF